MVICIWYINGDQLMIEYSDLFLAGNNLFIKIGISLKMGFYGLEKKLVNILEMVTDVLK
jgi:hypothetical protein